MEVCEVSDKEFRIIPLKKFNELQEHKFNELKEQTGNKMKLEKQFMNKTISLMKK